MPTSKSPYPGTAYHIAWICSTQSDFSAALTLLDKNFGPPAEDREPTAGDACTYTTGLMAGHKVVLVCMDAELPQPFTADNIVHNMRYDFPNLRFAMLVGVGSAVPRYGLGCARDVRLGDVVVGCQKGRKQGVVVYEVHNNGPVQMRTNQRAHLGRYIEQSIASFPEYTRPPHSSDHLPRLMGKDASKIPTRPNTTIPTVHFGTIASAKHPGRIPIKLDGHCVESEASSLQSEWPCLVIRGMVDYWGDGGNCGTEWRGYARASAAAFAKLFLQAVREDELMRDRIVIEELAVRRGVKKA